MEKTKILKNKTCFGEHKRLNLSCSKNSCKYWQEDSSCNNCAIVAAEEGPMTLQQIGDKYNLTRMRICQLEKMALNKILNLINKNNPSY